MKLLRLLSSLMVLVVGCGSNSPSFQPFLLSEEASSSSVEDSLASSNGSQTTMQTTITEEGIGPARLGMTLRELKQSLPEATFQIETHFLVDIDAIAVRINNQVQFYILYFSSDPLTDADPIQLLLTDNPKFRTPEGVGPETTIQKATAIYGQATLNYHTSNESREYVQFANLPYSNLSFRSDQWSGEQVFAGIYSSTTNGEYYETTQYRPTAAIGAVVLDAQRLPLGQTLTHYCQASQTTVEMQRCAQLSYQAIRTTTPAPIVVGPAS